MQTTLSYFSLTKIVEFTPFHLVNNHTEVRNTLLELFPFDGVDLFFAYLCTENKMNKVTRLLKIIRTQCSFTLF